MKEIMADEKRMMVLYEGGFLAVDPCGHLHTKQGNTPSPLTMLYTPCIFRETRLYEPLRYPYTVIYVDELKHLKSLGRACKSRAINSFTLLWRRYTR